MRESRGVMTTLSKILCGLIFIFMCFSFLYSLHGGNPQSSLDLFVSAAKRVLEHDDAMKNMIGGRKLMMASEKKEEVTRMKRGNRETEREASKSVDEDGLVAYTADYWRAKHHPPKNN